MPFEPNLAPINGSLTLSALVALLPLLTVLIGLGCCAGRRTWPGWPP